MEFEFCQPKTQKKMKFEKNSGDIFQALKEKVVYNNRASKA